MFDDADIPIECANCGRKTTKTVVWLKNHSDFTCGCGTRIHIDASQFRRDMKKVDNSINDLERILKRFGR